MLDSRIRKRDQIIKVRNERVDITTDTKGKQRIIRDCYAQLYTHKLDNLEEMDKFVLI